MERSNIKVSSTVCGLLILAAGVLLFAFNAGFLPVEYKRIVFSWQMLLIALGFISLSFWRKWIGGMILILIGGFFLLPKLNIEGLEFLTKNVWGIVLIVVGIIVLCKSIWSRHFGLHYLFAWSNDSGHAGCHSNFGKKSSKSDAEYIIRDSVFGNINEKIDVKNFKGGDIDSVFSTAVIDLSDAQLSEGTNYLKIDTVFGNIVIYAPIDWKIEIREDSVFGGFVDNRPTPDFEVDESKRLIIKADSVFGGGVIRCK